MKILVATRETQGQRGNDFCWCNEGELVAFSTFECDREKVDGSCGCKRSMVGMSSSKATTTMKVVTSILSPTDLKEILRDTLRKGGWLTNMPESEIEEWVERDSKKLLGLTSVFQVDDIVERRGKKLQIRVRLNKPQVQPKAVEPKEDKEQKQKEDEEFKNSPLAELLE